MAIIPALKFASSASKLILNIYFYWAIFKVDFLLKKYEKLLPLGMQKYDLFGVKSSNTYIWLKHMKNMFRASVQQNLSFNLWTIVWTLVCAHVCVWLLVYFCFVC